MSHKLYYVFESRDLLSYSPMDVSNYKYHFDLSPIEFRNALQLRCHIPLLRMPACCDGCGDLLTDLDFCH